MSEDDPVDVIVETPGGSRNKYEADHESGGIRLDRRLPSATVYPADYGFVPHTLGRDGDPLDALVLAEDPTFPGCVVSTRVLGIFKMRDEMGPDSKLITVPVSDARWKEALDLSDVPKPLLDEIGHFFNVYKDLEPDKMTQTEGFAGRERALEELRAGRARFRENSGPQ
jgi:inorganic pyrophosphatase